MPPLDLPRLLLRGSAAVLAGVLLLAAGVGLWRVHADAREEMQAAMALAATMQRLVTAASLADEALLQALRTQQDRAPLRHLRMGVRDAEGRLRLAPPAEPTAAPPLAWLLGRPHRPDAADDPPPLAWPLPRPDGSVWTVVISPTPDSERREALAGLAQQLAVLAVGALALLGLLAWQLKRALRPLQALLAAIERPRGDARLPAMPVRELQVIADALQRAEAQRRLLGERLQSLQEDERRRLAQELHDELGQRLTALRLDAVVLQRSLAGGSDAAALASALAAQADAAQQEVRALLARLAPRAGMPIPAEHLQALLQSLAGAQRGLVVTLDLALDGGGDALPESLLLAAYRISQEGLTNVVRHAGARRAWLTLRREGEALHWSLRDDGRGLADPEAALARGSGLAGLRERVWAFGGDLVFAEAGPGLELRATLHAPAP